MSFAEQIDLRGQPHSLLHIGMSKAGSFVSQRLHVPFERVMEYVRMEVIGTITGVFSNKTSELDSEFAQGLVSVA